MDQLRDNLGNLDWWVTVVVAGIILNVLSSYLKGLMDFLIRRTKIGARGFLARRKARHLQEVDEYVNGTVDFRSNYRYSTLMTHLYGTRYSSMALLLFFMSICIKFLSPLPSWIEALLYIISGVLFLWGNRCILDAVRRDGIIRTTMRELPETLDD